MQKRTKGKKMGIVKEGEKVCSQTGTEPEMQTSGPRPRCLGMCRFGSLASCSFREVER